MKCIKHLKKNATNIIINQQLKEYISNLYKEKLLTDGSIRYDVPNNAIEYKSIKNVKKL